MARPILNVDELEFTDWGQGGKFAAKLGEISTRLGAKKLGYNLRVLGPGKQTLPFNNRRVAEEMFFVLAGRGEIRIGGVAYPIRQGDVIACPSGGPESAHQMVNSSDSELRYLAVRTVEWPKRAGHRNGEKTGLFGRREDEEEIRPLRLVKPLTAGLMACG